MEANVAFCFFFFVYFFFLFYNSHLPIRTTERMGWWLPALFSPSRTVANPFKLHPVSIVAIIRDLFKRSQDLCNTSSDLGKHFLAVLNGVVQISWAFLWVRDPQKSLLAHELAYRLQDNTGLPAQSSGNVLKPLWKLLAIFSIFSGSKKLEGKLEVTYTVHVKKKWEIDGILNVCSQRICIIMKWLYTDFNAGQFLHKGDF